MIQEAVSSLNRWFSTYEFKEVNTTKEVNTIKEVNITKVI